ncbi:HNH endonuclease signature motif containing protein [Gordonia neofelifaecis]|uniref:HNH endonuclease n=1 Tax=Gordonia neofelifaecis NRRL B-59395 TaxID=644548 RepID=F1YN44_9ACTN|nr:HNH endonuclease signature motif containing protein [Gordonia neofelifaecis]EGD53931.1 HNH endonuclease [Gordonia neofelifaecis NRRL B-59395]
MSVVIAAKKFADHLCDELAPESETARLLAGRSRLGADDRELLDLMVELTRVLNLTTTALAGVTAAADRSGVPRRKHLKSATDMLKQLGHAPSVALRLARVGSAADSLPELTREARIGGVSVEHVDAVGRGVAFVEKRIPLDQRVRADLARRLTVQTTPADIDRRARELAIEWAPAPDEADPSTVPIAENTELNEMALTTGPDGRTVATLDVDALTGEELSQALDTLCKPTPLPDGSRDPRSAGQRRADAFGQIVRSYLAQRERPVAGGALPHVTLIVPARGADAAHSSAPNDPVTDRTGSNVASLGFTGPVSSATAGLVLCESAMRRVVVDGDSAPLDVGREHRLVTVAIRKALEARDRGCAFPGCGRPVSWTDAHHCIPWSEGGDTAVDNCVLLCRMHHVQIHQSEWQVFIGHDRHPWFRPPADPDRPRHAPEPIRSHARRTLTPAPTAAA